MNGTFNDFVIGNGTNVSGIENEILEQQTKDLYNNFERNVDSASQNQVIGNSIDDKIVEVVDNAVMTVEYRMLATLLTAMDKVVIPRVEMTVR